MSKYLSYTIVVLAVIVAVWVVVALIKVLRDNKTQTRRKMIVELNRQLEAARHALFLIRSELTFARDAQQPMNEEKVESAINEYEDTVKLTLNTESQRSPV